MSRPFSRPAVPRSLLAALLWLCGLLATSGAHGVAQEFAQTEAGRTLPALLDGDPAALHARLQPLRERFEGDPAFDVLLARAALATGNVDDARLAIERVQFLAPETPGIRELAIALQTGAAVSGGKTAVWRAPEPEGGEVDRRELRALGELVAAGRWAPAWDRARSLVADWEGDPAFDYLYGIAALESGRPHEALFALQRVLFFDPSQIRVRAQLARAHFLGGDLDQSEAEFRRVLEGAPPPSVAGSIQGYLDEIERQRSVRSPRLLARVEFAAGFDDNVNSATDDGTVATPLGTFRLGEAGRAQESPFTETGLRLAYEHPLSRLRTVDVVLAGTLRHNFDQQDFDLDVYRLEAGLAHADGAERIRGSVSGTLVTLGGDRFQQAAGAGLEYSFGPGRWRYAANLDATLVRYPENGNRDVAQLLGALGASYLAPRDLLDLGVFLGTELALEGEGDFNGRDIAGVSARWQHSPLRGHVPYVRYRFLAARHHADHPVFAERREDLQHMAALGWNWKVNEEFDARAELDYTETRSSLDLFDQDRLRFETGLSFRF